MRKRSAAIVLIGLILLAARPMPAGAATPSKEDRGTIVIVFKDGHEQTIPVSAITHMELRSVTGGATPITIPAVLVPGRGHFLGRWIVGQGNGDSFYITLEENGDAKKSLGAGHGTWTYADGEARVSWDDGWHDVIRKIGTKYEKLAYAPGKSFSDPPANVTEARNTSPRPI